VKYNRPGILVTITACRKRRGMGNERQGHTGKKGVVVRIHAGGHREHLFTKRGPTATHVTRKIRDVLFSQYKISRSIPLQGFGETFIAGV
jgi:hypothetical protein